jgi:hypothetical protein
VNRDVGQRFGASCPEQRIATVDQHATIMESRKQQALVTYGGTRGYQPVLAAWAEISLVLADEFQDGNVPAQMAPRRVARRAFAALPNTVREFAISLATSKKRVRRTGFDRLIPALVIEIRVSGYRQGKFSGRQPEPVHVWKDYLCRSLGDASVNQYGVLACEQVLKQVASAEQRLNLLYAVIDFHEAVLSLSTGYI